jgi:hypothetical protein
MKTLVMKYIGQLVAAGHAEWEMHEALGFFIPAAGHQASRFESKERSLQKHVIH